MVQAVIGGRLTLVRWLVPGAYSPRIARRGALGRSHAYRNLPALAIERKANGRLVPSVSAVCYDAVALPIFTPGDWLRILN